MKGTIYMDKDKIRQLADYAVRQCCDNSENCYWSVSYDELRHRFGTEITDSNENGKLLEKELRQREEINELIMTEDAISGSEPYTVEEVDTAVRYVIPEKQNAPIKWNEVTSRNFTNTLKKFTVTVTKSDAETGNPQGDASLAGAKYGIFKGNHLVDEYYTDENG